MCYLLFIVCMLNSPSIIASNAPDAYRVNWLCVEYCQILRINQFESTLVQVHEQILALCSAVI